MARAGTRPSPPAPELPDLGGPHDDCPTTTCRPAGVDQARDHVHRPAAVVEHPQEHVAHRELLKRSFMAGVTEGREVEPGAGGEAVGEDGAVRARGGPAGGPPPVSVPPLWGEGPGVPGARR